MTVIPFAAKTWEVELALFTVALTGLALRVVSWIHESDVCFKILNHTGLLVRDQEWKSSGADPPVLEQRRAMP